MKKYYIRETLKTLGIKIAMLSKHTQEVVTIEDIPADVLVMILMKLDPVYFGRMQLNRELKKKLQSGDKVLWKFYLERDFPNFNYNANNSKDNKATSYHTLYQQQSSLRKKSCTLKESDRKLFNFIRSGDLPSVQQCIGFPEKNSVDFLYSTDNEKVQPALLASLYHRSDILDFFYRLVLKEIFHIKQTDRLGSTRLHWASACNKLNEVRRLLRTTPIDKVNNNNLTPLYTATRHGHTPIIRELLDNHAQVDLASNDNTSPLHVACYRNYGDIVGLLLAAGADVNKKRKDGTTALFLAAEQGHVAIVEALLKARAKVDESTNLGSTPLFAAVNSKNVATVVALLKANANVNHRQRNGATPLSIAVYRGDLEVLKVLLKAKADLRVIYGSKTIFDIARQKRNASIFAFLKLWRTNEIEQHQPLYNRLIAILNINTELPRKFMLPFTSIEGRNVVTNLQEFEKKLKGYNNPADFRTFIESQKTLIPADKYQFIMDFVLPNEPNSPGFCDSLSLRSF